MIVLFVSSCSKPSLKFGDDILPQSDLVSIASIDTLSVFSYTNYDPASRTDNPTVSYLGQLYDPYFGSSDAGFVTQIRLKPAWDGEHFNVDSVKLYLHIGGYSGGNGIGHSISLYEIDQQIYTDSIYYSNTEMPLTGYKVTGIELPNLADTSDIELKLPNNGVDFGNHLIRDVSKLFYSNATADFRSYFKGLYFKMDPSPEPLLLALSLLYNQTNYNNYFVLFGHDDSLAFKAYSFILDAKNTNAAFNKFNHNFTTATVGDKMAHVNTTYRDSLSFMQSLNGVYTKLALPGLEKIKNDPSYSRIAVNRARITVPVYYKGISYEGLYYSKTLPPSLVLRYKTTEGIKYVVPDYTQSIAADNTNAFFDGKLDSVNLVYNFNIPTFVQSYLENTAGDIKPEVEIFELTGTKDAILYANSKKKPIKFSFTYSKF